jgi:hypothetical protein
MALAPSADNIILGKGELFWAPIESGVRAPYFHMGNCPRFAILLNDDVITLNSSMDQSGGVIKRVTRRREVNVEITSNEYGIENLALQMMGDSGTFTQASGAVTEVVAATVVKGRFYKLANRNVSGLVLNQGTVTWTLTTDYTLHDASAGIVQVVEAASTAVSTGTPFTAVYTRASLSLSTVLGATKTKKEGSLFFMPDPTTGPQFDVEVFYASASPGGEAGFISEEFGEYGLSLVAQSDSNGLYGGSASMPYFRLIQRGTN